MTDFIEAIRAEMGSAPPPGDLVPGKWIRFSTNGRNGDASGSCLLFPDMEGGVFFDWRTGESGTWQAKESRTPEEKAAFNKKVQEARAEAKRQEEERRAQCRKQSAAIWSNSYDAAGHPYLLRKGIKAYGVKQFDGNLLVPVWDSEGRLHGLQKIKPDGEKRFEPGTAVKGHFHILGNPDGKILIAEGYATAATLHEITGLATVCAFNAGNLLPVALEIRKKYPDAKITICADDDHGTEGNPGLTKGTEAALAVNGYLAVPAFPEGRGPKDTDFNDLARLAGPEAVRRCIETATMPVEEVFEADSTEKTTAAPANKIKAIDVFELMTLELPPRKNLLDPWLPEQGLTMIHAFRGIGKTHIALGVSFAVASGGRFLDWHAPEPRGVIYIDGEMPASVLQERMARIALSNELEPRAPLRIITPDLQPGGMIDLSRAEDQRELQPYLEEIDLIIVDNISCLCRTGKENEGESWLSVQEWALQQRSAGKSILFIHHTGKNGQQRGTSRREDVLDTVIGLRRPGDYTPDQGALFEVHFEKARGIYGADTKPFEAQLTTAPDGRQCWVVKQLDESTTEKVAGLLNDGVPQREIAELLGVTKGAVSKAKKSAESQGLLIPQKASFQKVSQFPH